MDLTNPIRSISPTVEADVLLVLARTHAGMTGLTIEKAAGRSHAQVRDVLRRLVGSGLVEATRVGNAVSYRLNREHVLADPIVAAAGAPNAVEARLAQFMGSKKFTAEAVVLFGSFARRDGGADSDIDVLLVRPGGVSEDDEEWGSVRSELAQHVKAWTGNECQVLDRTAAELREAAEGGEPLIASLLAEGRVIVGRPFSEVVSTRHNRPAHRGPKARSR